MHSNFESSGIRRKATPTNPRACSAAPGPGSPARSTWITPFWNSAPARMTSLSSLPSPPCCTASVTRRALRPLKVVGSAFTLCALRLSSESRGKVFVWVCARDSAAPAKRIKIGSPMTWNLAKLGGVVYPGRQQAVALPKYETNTTRTRRHEETLRHVVHRSQTVTRIHLNDYAYLLRS